MLYLIITPQTSIGVLSADNLVNPQMSLKYIVTHSNDSGSTTFAFFNCSAMVLKISYACMFIYRTYLSYLYLGITRIHRNKLYKQPMLSWCSIN